MRKLFCFLVVIVITAIGMLAIYQLVGQSISIGVLAIDQLMEQPIEIGALVVDSLFSQGDIIFLAPLTLLQLKDKRKLLIEVNEKLIFDGEARGKELEPKDKRLFDENINELLTLDRDIRKIENKTQRDIVSTGGKIISPFQESFSLMRTLRNMANKSQIHEADAEVLEQGESDFRENKIDFEGICLPLVDHRHEKRADILAGTATAGAEIVATDVLNLLGPLRNALVFTKVGAKYLTGLTGDVNMPKYAGSTAGWKTEVEESGDAAGAHSELPLTPMRITGHLDISKRYLIQDTVQAEELLKNDLVAAVAGLLEYTALGKIAAVAGTNPAGLLQDANAKFTGALAWGDVMDIEAEVDTSNALEGNLAYITHPSLRGIMKKTVKVGTTDSTMIMEGKELNGHPCYATSNMASNLAVGANEYGIAFANWQHLVIAQWGAIDLVVDPYTLASEAQVRIVVNSYWDFIFRHAGALAFGSAPIA